MTRIDRYLLTLYTRVLLICFLSVCGLLIVVDVFSNLDEFVRSAEHDESSLLSVLAGYYGPYMLSIFERLSGLLALLALLFTIAWLNKTHELTALLAAGVTKRRVIRPLLLASMFVILGAAGLREFAVPLYQDRLDRNPQDLTGDVPRPIRPTYDPHATALLQGKHLLPINREIVAPSLKIQGGPLAKTCGSNVLAARALYQPGDGTKPAGYLFIDVSYPKNIDQLVSTYAEPEGTPILLTSFDNDWIPPGSCFLVSDIEYEMLRGGSAWKQFASTGELIEHLKTATARSGDDIRVQIHQRFVRPAIDWTVLLLGIPVLLLRPDRHMFWVAGACLGIVAGFTAVVMALAAVGTAGTIPPVLAIWLPLLVFFPWSWAKTASAMET